MRKKDYLLLCIRLFIIKKTNQQKQNCQKKLEQNWNKTELNRINKTEITKPNKTEFQIWNSRYGKKDTWKEEIKETQKYKKKILSYGVQQNVICAHSNLQSYLLFLYIFENLLSFFSLLCIISLLAFFPPLLDRKMLLNIFLLIFILFQTFSLFPSSLQ